MTVKVSFVPDRRWVAALLARAFFFWLGARGIAAPLLSWSGSNPIELPYAQAAWLIAAVAFLVWWDTRRRGELLLLANLGHGQAPVVLLGTVSPLVMEIVIAILVRT